MAIINDAASRINTDNPTGAVRPTRMTTPYAQEQAASAAPASPAAPGASTSGFGNSSQSSVSGIIASRQNKTPRDPAAPAAAPVDPTAPFAPTGPAASTIQPITRDVAENETVQGQLGMILKNGNPLLEAAKTRAAQAANARGLQNSSMAVQSGEEAVVNTALPIAQQDAAAYQKQALTNQDISNQFLSQDKGAKLDLEAAYAAFQKNNYMFDKDEKLKRYINDTGISSNEKIAAMQAAAQVSSASIGASASMYGADKRLEEAGMTIEANKLMQQAGFDQQDQIQTKDFSQQNFRDFSNYMNGIQLSEMPPEAKVTAAQSLKALYVGGAIDPSLLSINMDSIPNIPTTQQP